MSAKERLETVRSNKTCFRCLNIGHTSQLCQKRFKCRVTGCDKAHHDLLHEACANGYFAGYISHGRGNADVLLQIQNIQCKSYNERSNNVNVLWDRGSTLSFITFQKARSLQLKGIGQINLHMTKVGGNNRGNDV